MVETIAAGSILVEQGTQLPNSPEFQRSSNGWAAVRDARPTFEKEIKAAGWTFFFMAGEIKATVFGFDRQKTLRAAIGQLTANAKSHNCNSIEITQVTDKSFLRLPYVSVTAHQRHLQKGLVFGEPSMTQP